MEVVKMTTSSAANNENVVKVMTFPFLCIDRSWIGLDAQKSLHNDVKGHTAHAILSWPNPEPWQMGHIFNFVMNNKIKYAHSHNHHKRNGQAENTETHIVHER